MQRNPLLFPVVAALFLAVTLNGCKTSSTPGAAAATRSRDLTPNEYQNLSDEEKAKYKDVVIRIPFGWGGIQLPKDAYPWETPVDKAIHGGEIATMVGLYNQTLFELQHPRVKVEYILFDMWTDNFRSALAVALSARRAPSYYIARDLPQTIEQGMYADLTDLMKKWDRFDEMPEASVKEGTFNGRYFTLAANELGAHIIRFRKDFFREAGIFDENGEPGPRSDWTFDDFAAICKKLTDPKKGRYGYASQMGDYGAPGHVFSLANGLDILYVPDPTGKRLWKLNDQDPDMLKSLQVTRKMIQEDRSVYTSVTMGWQEWHNEFDAGRASMISGFSPHVPGESLDQPDKFGADKPYREVVGMAILPHGPGGMSGMKQQTNPVGFDPSMTPEQLEAAFDWCKSWFYGDIFINRIRATTQEARAKGRASRLYMELLTLPYKPTEDLLDKPLSAVFPKNYLDTYDRIRKAPAPPLPREFGLREPPMAEWVRAMKAMYSEAATSKTDLKVILKKTADLVGNNLLNYRDPQDSDRLRRFYAARSEFYRKHFPRYYESVWLKKLPLYHRIPQ